MKVFVLLSVLVLAACGADGEPVQPGGEADVNAETRVGVVGKL